MKKSGNVLNDDPVLLRIMDLMKKQNRTDKDLIDHLGMANGVFTGWKFKGGRSYIKHIREIADYLGTTTGYLLQGADDDLSHGGLSDEEITILQLFRQMDDKGKACIIEVMQRFVGDY